MSEHENPPAFPKQGFEGETVYDEGHPGMTLRDWFASQALSSVDSADFSADAERSEEGHIANWCYAVADAMLAEREKGGR